MVRAAYSSGTPAIGVGPGNGPAYIEKTADLPLAVKRIMDSKTFDYGTICASEQSVVCDDDMAEAVQKEMEKQGAYFLSDEERLKLGKYILRANGTMNPGYRRKIPAGDWRTGRYQRTCKCKSHCSKRRRNRKRTSLF